MENIPPQNTIIVLSNKTILPLQNPVSSLELCEVCVEKPNKQRPFIVCQRCEYKACSRCVQKYLLSIPTPKCMNCQEIFTRPFLTKEFSVAFQKRLKIKNIQTKFEREISLLPLAQALLDHEKKTRELNKLINQAQEKITELLLNLKSAKIEKSQLVRNLNIHEANYKKRQVYIRPCPVSNCRGFLNNNWKCGICDKTVCSKCHEIKNTEEHTCNEDNIKSAKMIETDSRPCPKCHAYIFKIDGCNQLWCVKCHTAFDWNTGRIIEDTRYFHNPHYFDWMKTQENVQNNETEDICQEREINSLFIVMFIQQINPLLNLHKSAHDKLMFFIREKCRKIIEIKTEVLPKYMLTVEEENEDLRLSYLKNKIDLKKLNEMISRRYTVQESKKEYGQVLFMFVNSFTDIAFRLRREVKLFLQNYEIFPPVITRSRVAKLQYRQMTGAEMELFKNSILSSFFEEVETLRKYTNDCLAEIRRSYGLTREYYIDEKILGWKHKTINVQPDELEEPVDVEK